MMNFNGNVYKYIKNTYLGDTYDNDEDWGDFFYLEVAPTIPKIEDVILQKHLQFTKKYLTEEGTIIYVFTITPHQKKNIVLPFLDGKYSEIDRAYVKSHFKQYDSSGNLSTNWRILTKDEFTPKSVKSLRDMWKQAIGMELPPNAEVWSRPEKSDEIRGYELKKAMESISEEVNA